MPRDDHSSSHNCQQVLFWQLDPWPCLVVDNFLDADALRLAMEEVDQDGYNFTIESRITGRIEYDVLRSRVLWQILYSKSTVELLSSAFQGGISLDASNLIQLRRSNDDTPEFGVHNDFTEGENTIVSFLYLSDGWAQDLGGELFLYKHQVDSAPSATLAPILNRFIAFRTLPGYWHAVAKVRDWTRLSAMALWKFNPLAAECRS
jgi:hypothetical protein